jgi:hypothetical protein
MKLAETFTEEDERGRATVIETDGAGMVRVAVRDPGMSPADAEPWVRVLQGGPFVTRADDQDGPGGALAAPSLEGRFNLSVELHRQPPREFPPATAGRRRPGSTSAGRRRSP